MARHRLSWAAATREAYVRPAVTFLGLLAMLLGTFWVLQGTGFLPAGFMDNDINWAYRGAALFLIALFAVAHVRR
jgi:hypothetical protein